MSKELYIRIFQEVLTYTGKNISQLARELGLKPQSLHAIQNPEKRNTISKNLAKKICKVYPQINESYLLTGKGELLISEGMDKEINERRISKAIENISLSMLNNSEANKGIVELAKETIDIAKSYMEISKEHSRNFYKSLEELGKLTGTLDKLLNEFHRKDNRQE